MADMQNTNTGGRGGQVPRRGGPGAGRGDRRGGPGGPGGPGGRDGNRRDRDRSSDGPDLLENVININRVAKVVKGGRRFSFSAIVTVGDGKGRVGVAMGKANEISDAIRKASEAARANQMSVPVLKDTIPYAVTGVFGSSRVLLKPAVAGTGVIAAGGVRAIIEAAGIRNILTKQLGSRNPNNVVKATIDGLRQLRRVEEFAAKRGITVPEVLGLAVPGQAKAAKAKPVAPTESAPQAEPAADQEATSDE